MAKKPKVIIGFLILFLISLTFIGFSLKNIESRESTAELSLGENNFKISFNIPPVDQNRFEKSLGKLEIPKSIKNGITFELDSTASAQLAVISPISSKIKFSENEIKIEGQLKRPYTTSVLNSGQIKLPKSTNLAIAALSLSQLAKTKLDSPQALTDWIEVSKITGANQYFFNCYQDDNIFVFQSKTPIEDVKSLESKELSLKEESVDDMKIIYLTFQNPQNQQDQTISITKAEDLVFIASSPKAAKDIVSFQKSPKDEIEFPKSKEKISYVIYAKNNSDQFTNILRDLVLNGQPQTLTFTKNIDTFYLTLSKQSFSALINVK